MAKVVPSGVIQLPDFAQLDYNLKQQKRQEQLQFDDYLSRFSEIQGNYLAGDLEAVQGAYDNIESVMDKLAANPDDLSLRRELRNAYGNYSQLAGTAKFLADNNRQQRALYATNPDNFSLTSDEAMGMLDDDARTKRSSEQILGLAGSPLTLPLAYKYQLGSPNAVADEMFKDFSRIDKDFIKKDGSYDQDKITQWGNEWLAARYIDPEQKRNAVAYSALRQGKIGRNGKLTGREDLDRLDTPEFEPFRDPLLNDYNNQTIDAFMAIVPQMGVSQYQLNQDALRLAVEQNKQLQKNKYYNLSGGRYTLMDRTFDQKTGETIRSNQKGRGFMFPIEDIPVKLADGSQIISFGKFGEKEYVVKLVKDKKYNPQTRKVEVVLEEKASPASASDKAALSRATEGLYDFYMENISYSGEPKKQQQQNASLGEQLSIADQMTFSEGEDNGDIIGSSSDVDLALPSPYVGPDAFQILKSRTGL
jgi:hypothetical protein